MQVSRFFPGAHAAMLAAVACFASLSAQGAVPLPAMADSNLQACLTEQANRNGWQYAEEVTRLDCSGRGVVRLEGIEGLSALAELDLGTNEIQNALPLSLLRSLTKLNLSGNGGIDVMQVRPVLDANYGLTSLGLNGIHVGAFSNLGALFNSMTGRPYDLVELDLGNTGVTDSSGNSSLDFLAPYGNLVRLNFAGNGIRNIAILGIGNQNFGKLAELDLSNNALVDVSPLWALHSLTKLNLSGNGGIDIMQVRPVLETNYGLTSLGLNGIHVGAFSNLGALFNPTTGRPYDLVELDLGNTGLTDLSGNGGLDFLQPYSNLARLNVAGNGIKSILALGNLAKLAELDLSNNAIVDVGPLSPLRSLTKLNLSGNGGVDIMQVRPVLDANYGLTSLGLNGIHVGAFSNLGALFNPTTGRPYDLVELDLGNTGLSNSGNGGLDFLQPYSNLVRLNVAGDGINNIQVMWNLTRLVELDLSNNAIVDVSPLSFLRSLTKLNLSGNGGIDVMQVRSVLDANYGLTSLGLNGIHVGAFSNLGALFNSITGRPYDLVELDLGNARVTDSSGNSSLDFLAPYGDLVRLNVAGNGIRNIGMLGMGNQNFGKLAELDLSNNALVDVSPLWALHSLTKLNLSGNGGIDIMQVRPVLETNYGLTSLGLNGIRVGAFSNLGALFNPLTGRPYDLVELDLGNTGLNDPSGSGGLDFLQPYSNLLRLDVAGDGIRNIAALGNLAKLVELDLSNNAIVDVGPLSLLRSLTKLSLSGNGGIDIMQVRPVLDTSYGLTSLGLNGIHVGAFSNLGALFNPTTGRPYDLVELDLGNTGLTDLSGNGGLDFLQPYSNLARLNVAGNGIKSILALGNLAKLAELDLSNNAIVDVGPLSPLRSLTKLNLSGNGGVDIMQVRPVLDANYGLTSLGLNGIHVGAFSNLGALFNSMTGRPYNLVELDLGNTGVTDSSGNSNLDFLAPYGNLVRLNVAGNGIRSIGILAIGIQNFGKLAELDLSNNAFVEVSPLWALHSLTKLNLLGNSQIACGDLDNLALALPNTNIRRPTSCVGANALPVANAGANQTVKEGSPVTLSGSGTDSDGTIVSYAWVQIAGPTVTLSSANSARPKFVAPQVTANTLLTFRLTVTDNAGGTGSATTDVSVLNIGGVDLVITAVGSSVTTVRRGSSFSTISITKNAGDRSTSTSTTTGLYLSTDATVTTGDILVGTVRIGSLGPGASVKARQTVAVPRTLSPGTYYLGAIADSTKHQPELNEGNNSLTGLAIRVTR